MDMETFELTYQMRFAIALALGFLIGLERDSSGLSGKSHAIAGVRTYTLTGMFGFGCGYLAHIGHHLAIPVGLLAVLSLNIVSHIEKARNGKSGWTSEIAALLTFIVGTLCMIARIWIPAAIGIMGTILLSEKGHIEAFVENLKKTEFLATLKFLVVTVIVLPMLPNENFTQFSLNPASIWKIVIMVSSVGFVGYFLSKRFGAKIGFWLSGILGGIVSSTAVCVATGRMAQKNPLIGANALQASLLASSVMYLRILTLIAFLNPLFAKALWPKLVLLSVLGIVISTICMKLEKIQGKEYVSSFQNPFEIKPALIFAFLFVVLSVATVYVKEYFGKSGLLVLGGIIGVADVDPFILSLVRDNATVKTVYISAVLVAMMSNTIMKGVYFGIFAKASRKQAITRYGIWALLHIPIIMI